MTGNDWPNLQVHRVRRLAQAIRVSARAGLASVAARVGLASSEQRQRVRAEERKGDLPSHLPRRWGGNLPSHPLEEGGTGPELRGGTS